MAKGFTLIEMVIVMILLSILAASYISYHGNISDVSLDAASRKVQSDIRYAQQLATKTGVNHGVIFTAGGGYEVYSGSPGNPVTDPVTRGDMIIDLTDFQGVSIPTSYWVEFNYLGRPVRGGDDSVRLTTADNYKTVWVVVRTGAVVIMQ